MTDRKKTKGEKSTPRGATGGAAHVDAEAGMPAPGVAPEAAGSPNESQAIASDVAVEDIEVLAAERDEYLDHLRRLKAEFENYRKRVHRDNEAMRLRAAETVVESLLPVMDNMSRALEAGERHEEGQILAGLQLVSDQLSGTLEGHGLEDIPVAPGVLFDPMLHEAILTQASEDYPEGAVLQVLERGYLLHGRLLRPAKVIVVS